MTKRPLESANAGAQEEALASNFKNDLNRIQRLSPVNKKARLDKLGDPVRPIDNAFDIGVLLKQINNRYDPDSAGPFLVYVFDLNPNKNIGNIHPLKLGIKLFKSNIKLTKGGLFKAGPKKFCLIFNSAGAANVFVSQQIREINPEWGAFIPDTGLFRVGVVDDIPTDISNEDILEGLSPFGTAAVVKIERLRKQIELQDESVEIGLSKIKIFFKSSLPTHVDIFGALFKVHPFIPPVLRCFNCQRYGHGVNFCSSEARCYNCGGNHSGSCNSPSICPNCNLNHPASSKKCIFFIFNHEVNKLMSLSKIS